eukprot:TRINITY_DN77317_c0_g1_i1.p1 TRINITY_DN77317_c0_g1~~TRINITY_DN77317_c0_g1_i1.p1  ORF type:complete len:385 (-),score=48.21 TRINITY_DN77317_c0_g1_i1:181-1335(-)
MLSVEQDFVDPLFRPPLTLAITAASLKYLVTAWVLDDPQLKSKKTLLREREAEGYSRVHLVRIGLCIVFLLLSAEVFVEDAWSLYTGLPKVAGLQRIHAFAMVLAFSPNTVAAVAAACIFEALWLFKLPIRRSGIHLVSDILAFVYGGTLAAFYLMPLVFVSVVYGILGAVVVTCAFTYDFVTLPWRIYTGHLNAIRIAVPVFFAYLLWTAMFHIVIAGYFALVSRRYPELLEQNSRAGAGGANNTLLLSLRQDGPHKVAVRILGKARDVGLSSLGIEAEPESYVNVDEEPVPLNTFEVEANEDQDKCILNDQAALITCSMKIFTCLSVPLLQLCVIVAARVYLGESAWGAAEHSFEERTWGHYLGHVRDIGPNRISSLVWIYL